MIPLAAHGVPADAPSLADSIDAGLRRVFDLGADRRPVTVSATGPGRLEWLRIDVSSGTLRDATAARGLKPREGGAADLRADALEIVADPVYLEGAALRFSLDAEQVAFAVPRSSGGDPFLVPVAIGRGVVRARVSRSDLEKLLFVHAGRAARERRIELRDLRLDLAGAGPRVVKAAVAFSARKVVSARVRLDAEVSIDDALEAVVSHVTASIGGLLALVLRPLAASAGRDLEGRRVPLAAFSLGGARLRDLRVAVEEGIAVEAAIG